MGCVRRSYPVMESAGGADDAQGVQDGGHGRNSVVQQHCGDDGIVDRIHKEGYFHIAPGGPIVRDVLNLPTDRRVDEGPPDLGNRVEWHCGDKSCMTALKTNYVHTLGRVQVSQVANIAFLAAVGRNFPRIRRRSPHFQEMEVNDGGEVCGNKSRDPVQYVVLMSGDGPNPTADRGWCCGYGVMSLAEKLNLTVSIRPDMADAPTPRHMDPGIRDFLRLTVVKPGRPRSPPHQLGTIHPNHADLCDQW